MTLQLLHFKFPHIWGKFDFLFISVRVAGWLRSTLLLPHITSCSSGKVVLHSSWSLQVYCGELDHANSEVFSTDSKSAINSAFFIFILKMFEKIFLGSYWHFLQLLSQMPTKWLKKSKNFFYKCVLEFNFFIYIWIRTLSFSKKVKIVVV